MSDAQLGRDDYESVLAARRDLGAELEPALVDSFADRIEASILARGRQVDDAVLFERQLRERESHRAMVVAIVTAGVGIPLTAIALPVGGAGALLLVWVALVAINLAMALGTRFRRG